MQPGSKDIVCSQTCDKSADVSGEVIICDDVPRSGTAPCRNVVVISDEEDIEKESVNGKKLYKKKPGSQNQKELCKDLNSLLRNAMFYVMSSHKILEAEKTRLVRERTGAEKHFLAAKQMNQENNLTCYFNPTSSSDAVLSSVDQTMPFRIVKTFDHETLLNTNFASGCVDTLEKGGISDPTKQVCGGNIANQCDMDLKNGQDSNFTCDEKTHNSESNLNPQDNLIGCSVTDKSQDQRIEEIKEDKSDIKVCGDDSVKCKVSTKTENSLEGCQVQPKLLTGAEMKPFQIEGYLWLKRLYMAGINGILADEMGLGKTIQCVALICDLVASGSVGPFLICSPLSTLPHWEQSFTRFAPKVPILTYVGDQSERSRLRSFMYKKQICRKKRVHPVVLTSYEVVMKDVHFLGVTPFVLLILDEGHRIKNSNCKLFQALTNYRISHRFLLTGTPLQNNVGELFTLLRFILPELFTSICSLENWLSEKFLKTVDDSELLIHEEEQKQTLSILHQILTPFMLRRLKADVDVTIPPKEEIIIYTDLTAYQKGLYRTLLERFRNMSSQNTYVDASKICCPSRLRPRPSTVVTDKKELGVSTKANSIPNIKNFMKMVKVNHSCTSLLASNDDFRRNLRNQKGKEFTSKEDMSQMKLCGKKRKVFYQNREKLDVIVSNFVEQELHDGIKKEKQRRMENDFLNNSKECSSEVASWMNRGLSTKLNLNDSNDDDDGRENELEKDQDSRSWKLSDDSFKDWDSGVTNVKINTDLNQNSMLRESSESNQESASGLKSIHQVKNHKPGTENLSSNYIDCQLNKLINHPCSNLGISQDYGSNPTADLDCQDIYVNTNKHDSREWMLRSGRSSMQQMRTSTDNNQSVKRLKRGVASKLSDRDEDCTASKTSTRTEDCRTAGLSNCSTENSNISCNFSASSMCSEGFICNKKPSPSSCETGRGTLECDDDLEDVNMLSESCDNLNSFSSHESEDEEMEFTKFQLHHSLSLLRQCCSHPYMIERPVCNNEIVLDERLVTCSGKMMILDRLLVQLKKNGHKVLIFCQLLEMLDFLEDYCEMRGYIYCRLDGKMSLEDRNTEISKFSCDDEVFLFLLSTRAGGYGLNLTKADTVIIYESDLNPQCDIQAQDRCHRIGQERPVMIYRLLAANTIDQMMFKRAVAKKKLQHLVIHKGKFKTGMARYRPIGRDELEAVLKEEETRILQAASDDGSTEISDEDLRHLLDRSGLYEKWQNATRNRDNAQNAARDEPGSCTSTDIFSDIRKCTDSLFSSVKVTESHEVTDLENCDSLDVQLIDKVSSTEVTGSQEVIDLENSDSSDVELIETVSSDIEIIED